MKVVCFVNISKTDRIILCIIVVLTLLNWVKNFTKTLNTISTTLPSSTDIITKDVLAVDKNNNGEILNNNDIYLSSVSSLSDLTRIMRLQRLTSASSSSLSLQQQQQQQKQQKHEIEEETQQLHQSQETSAPVQVQQLSALEILQTKWTKDKLNYTTVPIENQKYTVGSLTDEFNTNITRTILSDKVADINIWMAKFWDLSFCHLFLPSNAKLLGSVSFHDSSIYNTVSQYSMMNLTFSCKDLYVKSGYGTGNMILAFAGIEFAAKLIGNIDVNLQCTDAEETQSDLILPWLMGKFPRTKWPSSVQTQQRTYPTTIANACSKYASFEYSIPTFIFRLRRMAVALLGVPAHISNNRIYQWSKRNLWSRAARKRIKNQQLQLPTPTRSSESLSKTSSITDTDDTIIHFRCGDIMKAASTEFGFMKYTSMAKYIPANTTSIGIVTQPFSSKGGQQRELDLKGGDDTSQRCEIVVRGLVDYLRSIFPDEAAVRISIRNDQYETIATTYARIIYANTVIVGVSSFGVIAGIASFGTTYILDPPKGYFGHNWYRSMFGPKPNEIANIATLRETTATSENTGTIRRKYKTKKSHKKASMDDDDDDEENINFRDRIHLIKEPIIDGKTCQQYWSIDNGATVLHWFRNDTFVLPF